jgi:SAM-dependent methyltransferase
VIHDVASRGFSRSADAYEKGRPGYPEAAVAQIASHLPAGATVLDLAAGTGKLTRPLLAVGLEVIAVEPVAEMRSALPASVRALEGTAEAIPLAAAEVDGVAVGQAFHWFDGDAALAEIHRVLRPKGLLALLWNTRVESDPVNRAIDELLAPYRRGAPTQRGEAWRAAFDRTARFGPAEEREFAGEQRLDADGMEARVGSISFIAALDETERKRVVARARAMAGEGTVTVTYRTEVLMWRRA